jgi:hypothetical protein
VIDKVAECLGRLLIDPQRASAYGVSTISIRIAAVTEPGADRAPDRSLNRPSTITVHSLCKSASERLKLAEKRTEAVERERWETIIEVDCKLQDASRALKQAQSRLAANEDRLTALEFRARAAEIEAREAKRALALVAEAIRKRLLCANPEAASRSA